MSETGTETVNHDQPLQTLPAVYEHCRAVYTAMVEKAQERSIDEVPTLVYEGSLTKLFNRLGLSVPYYTSCMTELKRMRCVEQLRRGGGGSPSIWALYGEPTPDVWRSTIHRTVKTKASKTSQIESQVRDLNTRVNKLEVIIRQLIDKEAV